MKGLAVSELGPMDLEYDVLIVGAGPAGLAAAVRLRQLQPERSVCVLEKGPEVGAHLISGALVPADLLSQTFPEAAWQQSPPALTAVRASHWHWASATTDWPLPEALLPQALRGGADLAMLSIGALARWLAAEAQALGVEIFCEQAVVAPLWDANGALAGVLTAPLGLGPDSQPNAQTVPGIRIGAGYVLVAEGARGSLTRQLEDHFSLRAGVEPPHYALGFREIWQHPATPWPVGEIHHWLGYPLADEAGGGFAYFNAAGEMQLGWLVHLDYRDPTLAPDALFAAFRAQPRIAAWLDGAERRSFGARVLAEGGWAALGQLTFPGGALIGCAAGLLDTCQRMGLPHALASAVLAAESVSVALFAGRRQDRLADYQAAVRNGPIGQSLRKAEPVRAAFSRFGGRLGPVMLSGWFHLARFGLRLPWSTDYVADHLSSQVNYRRSGGIPAVSPADQEAALYAARLQVNQEPAHVQLLADYWRRPEWEGEAADLRQVLLHCCPGRVYQATQDGLQIQAENCLHCKCCDIKEPLQQLRWTAPAGGAGPRYPA